MPLPEPDLPKAKRWIIFENTSSLDVYQILFCVYHCYAMKSGSGNKIKLVGQTVFEPLTHFAPPTPGCRSAATAIITLEVLQFCNLFWFAEKNPIKRTKI
jgi:hypothetical protein